MKAASQQLKYPAEECERIGRAVALHLEFGRWAVAERVVAEARHKLEAMRSENDRLRAERPAAEIPADELDVSQKLRRYFNRIHVETVADVLEIEAGELFHARDVGLKSVLGCQSELRRLGFNWLEDIEITWSTWQHQLGKARALARARHGK